MNNGIAGKYYAGSAVWTSGSTMDLISALENSLNGGENLIAKKLYISASATNKVKINNASYWSDLVRDASGSYVLDLWDEGVLVSSLYFRTTTGSNVSLKMIY